MEIDDAIYKVKPHLTQSRFSHTLRVAETAVELALLYHEPIYSVELAAVFHDYSKSKPSEEMKRWILQSTLPKDLLQYHHELWHGPVGSLLIQFEYGIKDLSVIDAIRFHTTGRAHMSQIELIVFLADYIEPARDFPGIKEVREMAEKDLVKATWMAIRNTIQFLIQQGQTIYPDTLNAYNDLTRRIQHF